MIIDKKARVKCRHASLRAEFEIHGKYTTGSRLTGRHPLVNGSMVMVEIGANKVEYLFS